MFENLIVDQSCGVQGTNNYSRLVACGQVLENLFVSSPMAQSAAMQGKHNVALWATGVTLDMGIIGF